MRNADHTLTVVGRQAKTHGATIALDQSQAHVAFVSGRSQRVTIWEDETHVLFESIAVRRVEDIIGRAELDDLILRTNHATEAVGLRRKNGALTAFVKLLKRTLDRNEAIHAIVTVAREVDQIELMMTGRDDE